MKTKDDELFQKRPYQLHGNSPPMGEEPQWGHWRIDQRCAGMRSLRGDDVAGRSGRSEMLGEASAPALIVARC